MEMARARKNRNNPVDDMYNVGVDRFSSNKERQQLYEQTQAGIDNLRQSTIDSSLSTASVRSDLTVEQTGLQYEKDIHSLVGFLSVVDNLLEEIEDTRKGLSKKGLSKAGKKTIDEAKTKLKQYEKQLKGKRKALLKQNKSGRAEVYENDIANLRNLREQLNRVRADIGMGQRGNFANTASYLYNSPEIAKKSSKHQADDLKFNQSFQEDLKDGAILNIFNRNTQEANNFFRRIAQGEYTQADYQLYRTNSAILNPICQRYGISIPTNPNGGGRTPETVHTSVDFSSMDYGEAFQQGGLAGLLDKTLSYCKNMTPGQRNTWKSVAVLGGFAAGIWGLYKFYTSNKSLITKAGITAAAIFGAQALTGEGPISLFKKLMTGGFTKEYLEDKFGHFFGDAIDGVQSSGIENGNELSGAMYSMMVFNENARVGDVRTLATKFKNNPQEWDQFRLDAITKLRKYGNNRAEHFSAVFSENFDENKWNEWLNSIGIHDGVDDDKLVYELASNKSVNAMIINKFLSDNGVKVTDNKTKKEEFEQYKKAMNDSNQTIDISTLEDHKDDRFVENNKATFTDRQIDVENKEKLWNQIDQLSIDDQKKAELKRAAALFYDKKTIENKPNLNDFSLSVENGLLILTSHSGQKTEIDINKGELVGFGHRFSDLSELLNVAYLSNKILNSQEGKFPKDLPPFKYKRARKGICFNDAEVISLNFDTRALSTGWWGATSKIENLSDYPGDYADYLSERRKEINKQDLTNYPLVKQLGIDFYSNEEEVKNLETYLQGVKEKFKLFECCSDGDPFSIELGTNKLRFKPIKGHMEYFPGDISKEFPTLTWEGNEEAFKKALNNPDNKMRGSALAP